MAMSALSTPSLALSTRLGAPRRGRRVVGVVCQQSPENKSQLAQGKGHGRRLEASAAGSSGDAVSIDGADFARMAAAVKLAAAVSPALSHRAKRFPPRRAAPRDPSTKSAKDASSDAFGPSHARMIEALGPKPGRDLSRMSTARAAYPGGWWGEGTYTDSLAQSDEGFGFKQKKRVTRRSSSTATCAARPSIDTSASKKFAADFKKKYGSDRMVADPQESAYNMVYLWKAAVEKANSFDDDKVREALIGIEFDAPQGKVKVMPNHHLSQTVRIGEITKDGQFKILQSTNGPVAPQAWNQYEPSSKGYACDWTDAKKGERYKL